MKFNQMGMLSTENLRDVGGQGSIPDAVSTRKWRTKFQKASEHQGTPVNSTSRAVDRSLNFSIFQDRRQHKKGYVDSKTVIMPGRMLLACGCWSRLSDRQIDLILAKVGRIGSNRWGSG